MKIANYFILLIVFVFSSNAISQVSFIKQNQRVDSLLVLHKRINSVDSLVAGYRIQIFFESGNFSKKSALETADEFHELYPEMRYYLSFNEPYYRIRVGDFRTLIEAKGFLVKLLYKYPSAFEVKDLVYFPPLPN